MGEVVDIGMDGSWGRQRDERELGEDPGVYRMVLGGGSGAQPRRLQAAVLKALRRAVRKWGVKRHPNVGWQALSGDVWEMVLDRAEEEDGTILRGEVDSIAEAWAVTQSRRLG